MTKPAAHQTTTPPDKDISGLRKIARGVIGLGVFSLFVVIIVSLALYITGGRGQGYAFAVFGFLGLAVVAIASALDLAATITGKSSPERSVVVSSMRLVGTVAAGIGALVALMAL